MSRWIVVDDTDPEILYSGPWFQDVGSLNGLGNYGSPYQGTSHGIDANGNFSYSFQGTGVIVAGSVLFPTSSKSPVSDPSWACSVDGSKIPTNPNTIAGNRLKLCGTEGLSDGPHNITVEVTSSDQHTFWLDYIRYLPPPGVNSDNAPLRIETSDSQISYGPGWKTYNGQLTQQTGTTLSFVFQGVYDLRQTLTDLSGASLLWLGFYDNSLPSAATTATYSVDGVKPVTFVLDGTAAQVAGAVQYNLPFFQTPELPPGNHTIQVVYQGDAQTAPLSLLFFETNEGSNGSVNTTSSEPKSIPLPSRGSSESIEATSSQLPNPLPSISLTTQAAASNPGLSSNLSKSSSTGATIGGALGGLTLLVSIFVAILYRRLHTKRRKIPQFAVMDPFYLEPSPTRRSHAAEETPNQGRDVVSHSSAPANFKHGRLGAPVARNSQIGRNALGPRGPVGSYTVSIGTSSPPLQVTELYPGEVQVRDEDSGLRSHDGIMIVQDLPPAYVLS
ncbi:hypothetical protein CVT26_013141 [Gymnopilus dilepis]|uniref:Uncharacterized protein n=1 Tax=Gymnopilus dilepis TaxID=231916 RepID=A0A409VWA4_9AGAR|nr:hypothetical protein CVT26_013141 [Gymnopilus dilepis]